jgi:hypothetical protein
MSGFSSWFNQWLGEPARQGILLLLLLLTLFLGKPLFTNQPLLAADLLFEIDPLWQPLAPPGFTAPANQVLSDQVLEFYPWKKFTVEELAQGRLPLWNPYVNSGHPLLANAQSAIFDPFNLVSYLVPLVKSFALVAFLRLLCAGTFTLLLALELGLSRFAAYLAMVIFTFGGPQIVWLLYPKASVLVWLPTLLFLSVRLIRTGEWRYVTWLGLTMGAQLLGGHPETSFYLVLVWLSFCLYWLWPLVQPALHREVPPTEPNPRQALRQVTIQLAFGGLLGLGVGAIQWLPLLEALMQSEILASRSQPALNWQSILFQWRDWLAALTMLMPDFFGNPRRATYWYPFSNYTEQTLFVGVLPLALALLVLLAKMRERNLPSLWHRQVAFFLGLGGISLALALRLPGFPLLAELPGLNVTNSARLRVIYMLAIAMLAGYGLDLYRQSLQRERASSTESARSRWDKQQLLAALLLTLGIGSALIAIISYALVTLFQEQLVALASAQAEAAQSNPFFFRPLQEYLLLAQERMQQMRASFHPTNWRMYLPILVAGAAFAAGTISRRLTPRPERRAAITSGLLLVIVVAELWLFGADFNPTIAPQYLYPTPDLVNSLLQKAEQEDDLYRIVGINLALVPNLSMIYELEDIRGYDPVAPKRYMELLSRLEGTTRAGHHLLFTHAGTPLLDFLNVRYAFATMDLGPGWTPVEQSAGVTLYANQDVMPRAFMVYASQIANTPAESLEMTLAQDFDFRNTVILESDGLEEGMELARTDALLSASQVHITRSAPGHLSLVVETAEPGVLVLSEPYTSGWKAIMDEKVTPILIANHAFRGLYLPEGTHTVTFDYQPISFQIGAWLTLISLGVLLMLPLFGRRVPIGKLGKWVPLPAQGDKGVCPGSFQARII